ncbi:MAG TPA: DUF4097 family beta strand repeat-containing protein [Eudoraea sp.]|nr:DUF4097 family beta strand repeat-containing protein [Eudoraea sp.]
MKKTLVKQHTSLFQINTINCFDLDLGTSDSDEMVVEAIIDGEYRNDLVVEIEEAGGSILVGAGFHPDFVLPNDKLSAHKVVSVALRVRVPDLKNVQVTGTSCKVTIAGLFKTLKVTLDNGRCTLKEVGLDVTVRTQSGDILLYSARGAVKAKSTYGKISGKEIPQGDNTIRLTSVTGDIHLYNTN